VDENVDKDIHRVMTGCRVSADSIPVAFWMAHVIETNMVFGVIPGIGAPHNHSNNLSLRI
jgi:hypothetical protein